jgi:virginiamycin B lyase
VASPSAAAGAGQVTWYAGISSPSGITAGPDGALWFTNGGNNSIGRITTTGQMMRFTGASVQSPTAITARPDGALWFTNTNFAPGSIGRITTKGTVTSFTARGILAPTDITVGSDRALWFTDGAAPGSLAIGRISTMSEPVMNELSSEARKRAALASSSGCASPSIGGWLA